MSKAPSSRHSPRYRPGTQGQTLLRSDVFERVSPALIAAMAPWLGQVPGTVLEVGAGTGQHAAAFARAFPALAWWPSDPDPLHRASCLAWAEQLRVPVRQPLDIDAASSWWDRDDVCALGPLSAIVACNVIHIAPVAVAEGIVRGAGRRLAAGGLLAFAGPLRVYGQHVGEGNATFDAMLRADDPEWGLRDVADIEDLAQDAGLDFAGLQALPANNRLLIFRKTT